MKKYLFTLVVLCFLLITFMAYANNETPGGMGGWHMMDEYMGGGVFMWLFLVIVIVVVVYFLVDYSKKQRSGPNETPLDVLKKRYARGEISKEEYEQMKQDVER